jgi:essential nuclear protein 1
MREGARRRELGLGQAEIQASSFGGVYSIVYLSATLSQLFRIYLKKIVSKTSSNSISPQLPKNLTMPKAMTPVSAERQARRHNPLEEDLTAIGPLKNSPGKRKSRHQDEGEQFVDSKASRKILRIGQELADEDAEENQVQKPNTAFDFESRFGGEEDEEPFEDAEAWGDEEEVEEIELAPDDLETFSKFFPTEEDPLLRTGWGGEADDADEGPGTNLADLILEKIAAHEAAQAANGGVAQNAPGPIDEDFEIPTKVVEVYSKYDFPKPVSPQLLIR